MTGRLPQMVRKTVDVDLLRGWRGEAGGRGSEEELRDEHLMVGTLQGWKAAVDALDQSERCGVCCVGSVWVGSPAIRSL